MAEKTVFHKVCQYCHKPFTCNARHQRFCCSEHQKTFAKLRKKRQREYKAKAETEIIRVQAHKLGVAVLGELKKRGRIEHSCAHVEADGSPCTNEKGLECHHRNCNWLDNRPPNLEWRCKKHHTDIHNKIDEKKKRKKE